MGASAAALGFAVFARALTFGFAYDDTWTIVRNGRLAGPLRPLLRALMAGTATKLGLPDATRPAMVTSMWLDRHLFGLRPLGYHAHSLLLYAAVSALAALLLLALTRSEKSALVGGLFFAAAPLHAEVAAAANYREDLLASLGMLIALLFLWWPFPAGSSTARGNRPLFASVLAVVSFTVALLSKESAVALVLISTVIAVLRWPGRGWLARNEASLVALLAVVVVWASWRFGLPAGADDVPRDVSAPFAATIVATARFEVLAVKEALFPFGWSPEHSTPAVASPFWLVGFLALIAAMVWLARRRAGRLPVLGLCIALAAALPSSPLAGPANRYADRYFFLAVLGGALVWGVLATRTVRYLRARVATSAGAARRADSGMAGAWYRWLPLAALLPLVIVAQRAVAPWKNDATLWSVAVERAPESPRAWAALSRVHRLRGELDSADEAVAHALALEPSYAPARLTRIYNRLARGDVDAARVEIEELRLADSHLEGFETAIGCAARTPEEARACIRAASRDPQ
jgi:tetratricopeptide (TPR) repeat protein